MNYKELALLENAKVNQKIDGFYNLEADKKAIEYFENHVKENSDIKDSTYEHMCYLIDKGLIVDFRKSKIKTKLRRICKMVDSYVKKNKKIFESYIQISKFYNDYALKSEDKAVFLEHFHHRCLHTVLYVLKDNIYNGTIENVFEVFKLMYNQIYQPATPTFLNAGKIKSGELVSCFLLEVDDSLNSIGFNINTSMQLSKGGGGVALNLSNLRGRGATIKGHENASKGVIPVVKILEDSFNYADQMGQRKGAGAVYLNIFHYDIEEFLNTKKINADEKSRIQTLSLGVLVPDVFFKLAKENKEMYVFEPYSVYKETGINFTDLDMTEEYDNLVANVKITKKLLNARDLLTNIAKTQFESGYPYLIYFDNANRDNPLKGLCNIKMSNLCTEIMKIQKKSVINDYSVGDEINYDINCILCSLNIVKLMESKERYKNIENSFMFLSDTADVVNIKNAPTVKKANDMFKSVGLGVMNLHGYFIKNNIMYESEEAKKFVDSLFEEINYFSIKSSMEKTKITGKEFEGFADSDYISRLKNIGSVYFNKYIKHDKITYNITENEWLSLERDVDIHGMYNSYRLCIAPTQSISYISNATSSIFPIINHIETRTYGNSTTYYPAPYLTKDNALYYKDVYKTDMYKMLDLVAVAQKHIDQGISTVLYVNNKTTTAELVKLYIYAWKIGLKSLYYTRCKNLTIEECLSCGV